MIEQKQRDEVGLFASGNRFFSVSSLDNDDDVVGSINITINGNAAAIEYQYRNEEAATTMVLGGRYHHGFVTIEGRNIGCAG